MIWDGITLPREQVLDALYAADLDEGSLYEGYSGRGMYGAECFGIQGAPGDAAKFLIGLAGEAGSEIAMELAAAQRTDSLGLGQIAYFPSYAVEGEGD